MRAHELRTAATAMTLGLLVFSLLFVRSSGADPAASHGGRIAFASYREGNWEICVMNADGTGLRSIAGGPAPWGWDGLPWAPCFSWSPDGAKIAYECPVLSPDSDDEIWVRSLDGSEKTKVASGYSPAWSPEGTKIAFSRNRDIWVMDVSGGNETRLTHGDTSVADFAWSPDGTRIAFVSFRSPDDFEEWILWVMRADGTDRQPIAMGTSAAADVSLAPAPIWSPDGQRIAFESWPSSELETGDIWVVNADGTGKTRLTSKPGWDRAPAWSPDGARIAFVSWREPDGGLYIVNANGTGLKRLIYIRPEYFQPQWSPCWSPDGSKIAFVRWTKRGDQPPTSEIWVMNADGTGQKRLTNDRHYHSSPAWCPGP